MSNRHFNLPATFGGAVARRPRAILAHRHVISLNLFFGTVHHFEEADAGDSPCQSPWKSIRCCLPGATAKSSKLRAVSPARVEKKTMERRKRTRKRRPGIFLLNLTESSFMNPPLYRSISGISQASALSNGRDSRSSEVRKRRVPVTKIDKMKMRHLNVHNGLPTKSNHDTLPFISTCRTVSLAKSVV
ncbi:uncharacterized protein BKA78DRAFT_106844 [Phyllosticta capitalensis]|uniref:uncharacterized protein n=1 Tax=Phyllosticta capitalensis TaxID=121624 RepID=UPI00312EB56F